MTGLAISDFNIETFAGYLSNDAEAPQSLRDRRAFRPGFADIDGS